MTIPWFGVLLKVRNVTCIQPIYKYSDARFCNSTSMLTYSEYYGFRNTSQVRKKHVSSHLGTGQWAGGELTLSASIAGIGKDTQKPPASPLKVQVLDSLIDTGGRVDTCETCIKHVVMTL